MKPYKEIPEVHFEIAEGSEDANLAMVGEEVFLDTAELERANVDDTDKILLAGIKMGLAIAKKRSQPSTKIIELADGVKAEVDTNIKTEKMTLSDGSTFEFEV